MPAIASVVSMPRPVLAARVLCENVGAVQDLFRVAMGVVFGLGEDTTQMRTLTSDAGGWTPLPRARALLSTLPRAPGPQPP
eukprot:8695317-Lingulodinium_polyedra.AAC.1